MRLSNTQAVARPTEIDRNELTKVQRGVGSGAPHVLTQRWSYTVPAGRKFKIASAELWILRDAVATTASLVSELLSVTPSGGAATTQANINIVTNGLGDNQKADTMFGFYLNTGDTISNSDQDLSTAGTTRMEGYMSGNEFDA